MPHSENNATIRGTVVDVFAHRFVVETANSKILADLGKHNTDEIVIKAGDKVEITGEQKPSELKIREMILNGHPIPVKAKEKDQHEHNKSEHQKPANPELAVLAAKQENIKIIGEPRRKPKHFEVLGKTPEGKLVELHIELDGKMRKTKPVEPDDEKWAKELSVA